MPEQKKRGRKNVGSRKGAGARASAARTQSPLEALNAASSPESLLTDLGLSKDRLPDVRSVLAQRRDVGGAFRSLSELKGAVIAPAHLAEIVDAADRLGLPAVQVPHERTAFRALLALNPNYFGNLEASPLEPVKPLQADTSFEDMPCVGLNAPFDRLEAVVCVKKAAGYGGSICTAGSREYVRFYVDLEDDGTWHDVGLSWVRVHDISGPKPLCYAVFRDFSPIRKLCLSENIVKVRAILSWNAPPPPDTPAFLPVWGERRDTEVVIRPRRTIIWADVLEPILAQKVQIPDPIGPVIEKLDPASTIGPVPAPPPTLSQKKALYKKDKVPAHRFAYAETLQLMKSAAGYDLFLPTQSKLAQLGLSKAEVSDAIGKLAQAPTDGDTSFEELTCVGYRPESSLLEAVIHVKKKSGYSGSLCTDGSLEYVAFWADLGDGHGFTWLGTSSVPVHDLSTLQTGGVDYAVQLKKDLSPYLIPCRAGARLVSLRAILSWQTAPPTDDPGWVPVWGNREECRIQLESGRLTGHTPVIETIGDIESPDIDQATALATGPWASTSTPTSSDAAVQAPFSGSLMISGRIGSPPNSFGGGATAFKYRVEVAPGGTSDWKPLNNDISVKVTETVSGVPYFADYDLSPSDDGDGLGYGWYTYLEDTSGSAQRALWLDKLAVWQSAGFAEGLWKMRITAKDPDSGQVFPGVQVIRLRLDHTRPSGATGALSDGSRIQLTLTEAVYEGQPITAVECGKFPVGTVLSGHYEVHDPGTTDPRQHFGALSLSVLGPAGGAPSVSGANVPGHSNRIEFDGSNTTGAVGTWTLDTSGMKACGYVLRLWARDRTIVGGKVIGYRDTRDLGFCLESPGS